MPDWSEVGDNQNYGGSGSGPFGEDAWSWLVSQYWADQAAQRAEDRGQPLSFSAPAGAGAAPSGGGGGLTSLASPGTASQGIAPIATGNAGLAGLQPLAGGAVAGSTWWQNPTLWTTLLGAWSGYENNRAASKGGGPTNSVSTTTPHPALYDDIFGEGGILSGARDLYQGGGKAPRANLPGESQALIDYLMGQTTGGPSPLVQSGSAATQRLLDDPYASNPFLQMLSQGSQGGGGAQGAIMQFLSGNGSELGGGSYQSPTSPQGYTPGLGYNARTGYNPTTGQTGGGGGGGGGGSYYRPASTAAPAASSGLFDQNIEQFLNYKDISPETQAVLDAQQKEGNENYLLARGELSAEAEGLGRFGGSDYRGDQDQLFRRHEQNMNAAQAATLERDLVERRNAALSAMGLISERDLTREQIAAQKQIAAQAAASASASAARAVQAQLELGHRGFDIEEMLGGRGLDIQEMLGLRGQNLDALSLLSGNQNASLDRLSGAAGTLGSIQLGALGTLPGTEGAQYQGLEYLLPLLGQKTQLNAQNASAAARAPGQNLDDFMQRILALSDRFSTRTGTTEGPAPYTPSLWSSVGTGALGGYLAGQGARG